MVILDIGCGRKKINGAIGIDFSPMSDADVVLDLNHERLPFDDDSVDFVYSSHALEHLSTDGFMHVLAEIYRVLKPDGQFKLVVPYFTVQSNLANPFHNNNICFNEHTFRFFSSDAETQAMPPEDYASPSCPHWGLRYSANSELGIEFRTLQVKYLYFPDYLDLSADELRAARASKSNVVDQIIYSLSVVKPCPIRPETGPVGGSDDPHAFVAGQLDYLRGQIEWLDAHGVEPSDVAAAKTLIGAVERQGDLYSTGGLPTPVNLLIFELDEVIQRLRRRIDAAVEASRKAETVPSLVAASPT